MRRHDFLGRGTPDATFYTGASGAGMASLDVDTLSESFEAGSSCASCSDDGYAGFRALITG